MGITLLATLRGIPQLYYGTEFGFRTEDSSTQDGGARRDFSGGWESDRKNFFKCHNCSAKEKSIYQHTKKLFNWRKTATAVHIGKTIQYLPDGNTYSFVRYTDTQVVFVFLNNTAEEFSLEWDRYRECIPAHLEGRNILEDKRIIADTVLTIPAHTSVVIDFRKE
ncbi:MAG: cyclomaltodextrinase C-terminal domain-containing protein [Tannerellaceae bacterium]|nr:cyclomaltodextrinase C-terminal domain-containing protein [Tannerellaceae bacterium]